MIRSLIALGALALVAAVPSAALAQQDSGGAASGSDAAQDTVVARVNGNEIRQSDIARAFARLPAQYQQVPINVIFTQLVQQLVDGELLAVAGRADNLQDTEEVKAEVAEFEKVAIQRAYMERLVDSGISEEQLRENYDNTVAKTEGPVEVRASHILVESEAEAVEVLEALDGGADFAELARERSTGPSGPNGGDLGYFVRSAMVQPFADAAFAIEPGEIGPDAVQSQFGWHVIKVVDKRRQPPPTFEEARGQIEEQLTRELIAAHMADLRADAKIELFNIDGSPIEDAPKQ